MLEFLAAIVCLFVTILWTVQLIIMIYTYVVLAAAAKEGVRYAVVHGSSNASGSQSGPASGSSSDCATNITAVETAVQRAANYPGMTVTVCYLDGNNKPPNRVSVNVSYPMTGLFTLGWSPPTVKAAAQGRITF
jgi:Flp pilus assembly protein TadG